MLSTHQTDKAKEYVFNCVDGHKNYHIVAYAVLGKSFFIGTNRRKTHPEALRVFPNGNDSSWLHAEIDVVMKVPRDSRASVKLFVVRFLKNGDITMAKPCPMCQDYLNKQGVNLNNVWYTDWCGKWRRLGDT